MGVFLVEEIWFLFDILYGLCWVLIVLLYAVRGSASLMVLIHKTCFCNIRSSFLGKCIHFLFYSCPRR